MIYSDRTKTGATPKQNKWLQGAYYTSQKSRMLKATKKLTSKEAYNKIREIEKLLMSKRGY